MDRNQNKEKADEGGLGRTNFIDQSKNEESSRRQNEPDISSIDQQEGEMNNGVIGRDWESGQHAQDKESDHQAAE